MPTSVHTSAYKDLVDRIIAARTGAGMTQQEVADRLGKPQSYVAKVEGRERRLDVVEMFELAKAIGFDPFPALKTVWKSIS